MKKRNPDTRLANWALQELAEYIASRRDLDKANPREIEAALKKAGKLPPGDHYYTAYHAGLKALRIQRQAGNEWMHLETLGAGTEEVWGGYQHATCGTVLEILQGYYAHACPKCHAQDWAAEQKKAGLPIH